MNIDFPARLKKAEQFLQSQQYDLLIVENPIDIYYLTGLELSCGKLLLGKGGGPVLFVDGRYYERSIDTPFLEVMLTKEGAVEQWLSAREESGIEQLAFDSDFTSYKSFLTWEKITKTVAKMSSSGQKLRLQPIDAPIKILRRQKEKEELEMLRKAAQLGSSGYDFVLTLLSEGITEREIANELEIFWKRHSGQGLAFEPIIAFGRNSAMPHHHSGTSSLKRGDIVLIDIGVTIDHYHSDMTRCVFFGPPHPLLREKYLELQEVQERVLKLCCPGVSIKDLDAAARNNLSREHFIHGLGHGVGLEVHELPVISEKHPDRELSLQEGMVITIEPGLYFPGVGGIRIEDTVAITSSAYEDLTKRSKELTIID